MHDPIAIQRVHGVEVRMSLAWPLLVFTFFVSLAAAMLATRPSWSIGLSIGLSLIASAGLAASLAARDAIQALVARRLGMPMTAITMSLAGSAPVYARARRSAVREALVATLGPLVHVAIGLAFLAFAGLIADPFGKLWLDPAGTLRTLPPGATAIAWIGLSNLAVAALDALPAYPLDGGRVVRSLLWETTGDHRRATAIAARLGQAIALVLIVIGISSAFRLGPRTIAEGVWLVLAGWSLLHASSSSLRSATIDDQLAGTPVSQLARPVVRVIRPDAPLALAVVKHFVGTTSRALPVMEDETCVGVLRFEDLRKIAPREWADRPVRDAMMPIADIPRIAPETDLAQALRELVRHDAQVAPVIDEGDVVGVIEIADVVRWLELAEPEPVLGPEPEESIDLRAVLGLRRRTA